MPGMFSIADTLKQGFEQNGCECMNYDVGKEVTSFQWKVHSHIGKLPFYVREKWYSYFVDRMNNLQLEQFKTYKPDLVIASNAD